ncbi:MAG: GntR family transcriptional regulator [Dongiaceae bacterium]
MSAQRVRRKETPATRDPWKGRGEDHAEAEDPFRDASRADYVYRQMRQAIRDGHFRQGDRVREEDVARTLGVSRTPVREALRQLQSHGLLDVAAGRGLGVVALDRPQVLELYAMRALLEGAAARLAAQHATPAEVAYMRHLLEEFRRTRDATRHAAINRALHEAICDAAHNRYMMQSLQQLGDALALLQGTTFSVKGRPASADIEHKTIVDAIAVGDPDAAEVAARAHIRNAESLRLQMMPL